MDRAHALFVIKAVTDGAKRTFSGIATTPTTDRMGDIVEPKGAQFKLPLPLLWQHDGGDPIGWITSAKVTAAGIEIQGEVADIADEGPLKQRLNTAWQYLKSKLVRGLSIGFNPVESKQIEGTYSYRFTKWDWLELSAVTIPANQDASITLVKSIDRQNLAALGREVPPADRNRPGASGQSTKSPAGGPSKPRSPKGKEMNTLKDMVETRATKNARLKELIDARTAESRAFTDDEGIEFDDLTDEVKALDDDIRIAKYHAGNASAATPVETRANSGRTRGPDILVRKQDPDDAFAGQAFTRLVIAKALAHVFGTTADRVAEARWGKSHPKLVQFIKADVAGGGSGSGEWGAELVSADNRFTGDFITYLYGMTVFDRLPLRPVPANVAIKGQDGASTGYWVGESKGIPVTTADFSSVSLTPLKVGAIAVVSNELLRDSSPSAEMLVRDSLAEASSQRVDSTFLSTSAASAGVSPAGILNGVTIGTSAGTDLADLVSDITGLYQEFQDVKNTGGLVWVMRPQLAMQIRMLRNTLGIREYPDVGPMGGTLEGMPVITGDNVGAGDLILMKPSDVWKIGDGGVQVSISRDAMIEQSDGPSGATDTPASAVAKFTSMFQEESTAIKVVRSINFQKRRTSAVAYIGNATYGLPTSI